MDARRANPRHAAAARKAKPAGARAHAGEEQIHAVLMGRLIARPHVSALVGLAGRRWLAELELPTEERETLEGCMRQIEFLDEEIAALERVIARAALESAEIRRLLSVRA